MARDKSLFKKMMDMKEGDTPLCVPFTSMRTVKSYRAELQGLFPNKKWTLDVDTDRMVVNVKLETNGQHSQP